MPSDQRPDPPPAEEAHGDAALRALATRYQELFAQAQDVIYVLDAAGKLIDLNAAGERLTGYSREELIGRPITHLVLPEYLPTMLQMLERKLDGLPLTTYELEIQARDGRRVALDVSTRLVYRDGRPAEIHGIARDITQRKRARDGEHFLADVGQVLASSLDDDTVLAQIATMAVPRVADYCLVDVIEPDGRVRRAAATHHDPAFGPLLQRLARDYPPRPAHLPGVPQVLRDGETIFRPQIAPGEIERAAQDEGHLELLRALGPYAAIMVPVRLDGAVVGAITLALSTSGRSYGEAEVALAEELARRAGQALGNARLYRAARQARSEAEQAMRRADRLQQLTSALAQALTPEQIADAVVEHGVAAAGAYAGTIVMRGEDAEQLDILAMAGYPPGAWDARAPLPILSPTPLADAARSGEPVWLTSRAVYAARYPHLATQTQTPTAALAAIPLSIRGRVIGALGLSFAGPREFDDDDRGLLLALAQQCAQALERARLYSQEQRARAEAEAAVQLRDTFLSVAAHELKTPLTALIGQLQLLQRRMAREPETPAGHRQSVDVLNGQARRLSRLVHSLLDVTRLQQQHLSLERAPFDLAELVARVVDEVRPTLTAHQLEYSGPAAPLPIAGDQLRLEQVLLNLIENAVKYSPEGGPIAVRLRAGADAAEIAVADQGIGVPEAALPHLFTRFYRAGNASAARIGGLGIGLFVVREIVALHGGEVAVASEPGRGSVFTVRLPLAPPDRIVSSEGAP